MKDPNRERGIVTTLDAKNRLSRCIQFCVAPPTNADRLVLHVVGDPPIQLGEWMRGECNSMLGHELESLMADHHEDAGVADSKFAAQYLTAEGRPIKVKTFTARTRPEITSDDAAGLAASLDGSDRATSQLAQQTALAMVKLFLSAQQAQTQSFVQLMKALSERVVDADSRTDQAREDLHEMRRLLVEMQSDAPLPEEMSPAQKQFFDLANKALPLIVSKMGAAH